MTGGDDDSVIEAIELSARRRGRQVLDGVSFQVRPGQVTGLLGQPGAGKTAVLRRMLQLDPGGGRTHYDGRTFRMLRYPMRTVGAMLDPLALHPGRTVGGHLRLALSADPGAAPRGRRERIAAVLDVCGLSDQVRTRIAELTEGMTVRLALAQALLGDPQVLLLDEPDRGLEPEGQDWLNALLRAYAEQGRSVLVTGQHTDTMVLRADRILMLDEGRLVGQRTARQAARDVSGDCVIVRTPQVLRFAAVLVAAGAEPNQLDGARLEVRGLDRARVGDLAFRNEIPLHELAVRSAAADPVVAVLEACRRPPTVLPVQAPATARVPEHHEAEVKMPFTGFGSFRSASASASMTPSATTPLSPSMTSSATTPLSPSMTSSASAPWGPSMTASPSASTAASPSASRSAMRSVMRTASRSAARDAARDAAKDRLRSAAVAASLGASMAEPGGDVAADSALLSVTEVPKSATEAPTESLDWGETSGTVRLIKPPQNDDTVANGQESVL
jgi:ABC-2 type transport system ATP-binding protein